MKPHQPFPKKSIKKLFKLLQGDGEGLNIKHVWQDYVLNKKREVFNPLFFCAIIKIKAMPSIKINKAFSYSFSLSNQIEIKNLFIKYVSGYINNQYFSAYLRNNEIFPILGLSDRQLLEQTKDKINNLFVNDTKIIKDNIYDLNKEQEKIINKIYSDSFKN